VGRCGVPPGDAAETAGDVAETARPNPLKAPSAADATLCGCTHPARSVASPGLLSSIYLSIYTHLSRYIHIYRPARHAATHRCTSK